MEQKEMVLQKLAEIGVPFECFDHEAVYTIEGMLKLGLEGRDDICKNLFLRDSKGKNHFLVVVLGEKKADLASLSEKLGTSKLSFASDERLMKYLGLTKGAVTPFGVLNDGEKEVTVVLDKELVGMKRMGFHPNVNTATVFLSYDALMKVLENWGGKVAIIEI